MTEENGANTSMSGGPAVSTVSTSSLMLVKILSFFHNLSILLYFLLYLSKKFPI